MQTRTLGQDAVRLARLARLQEPHIAPLTAYVDRIRKTTDPHEPYWAPYFDPDSGGLAAQVLLLMESPGPQVSQTGFVSLDNPDGTAENLSMLLRLAGLSRSKILMWNSFPWQLSAERVVMPTDENLEEAAQYTLELLSLLPALKAVVLVGSRAARGWQHVRNPPALTVLNCPHPSPVNFGPKPGAAALALSVLGQARTLIGQQKSALSDADYKTIA
ncbi:uracil-DNA glycosylase [Deinococcus sp.]|uniref:uracil-DNA glycosylase n=1 Tax=Deinococcus sp. TaxID=47478 RepID=UPI0025E20257|nr:uracil-DNA glycosylase [Deinococcus sp.]